jgi:uncharacterized coiled-coil protein SlyX
LEAGNIDLGTYVKLDTLQSSITETKKEVNDYTNAEIEKLKDVVVNEVSQLKAVSADTRLIALEAKVTDLENTIKQLNNIIKNVVNDYLTGTESEVKITQNNEKLQIGFADDAIFG